MPERAIPENTPARNGWYVGWLNLGNSDMTPVARLRMMIADRYMFRKPGSHMKACQRREREPQERNCLDQVGKSARCLITKKPEYVPPECLEWIWFKMR